MNSEIINIKVAPAIKKQAQRVAEALGLSLSSILKGYLHQLIYTKTVTFSVPEEPNSWTKNELKKSEQDYAAGRHVEFTQPEEALRHVDRLIAADEGKPLKR